MPTSMLGNPNINSNENKDNKEKRMLLNFNSQCDKILGIAKGNKTTPMDKVKLVTCYLLNNTPEKADNVHRENVLLNCINKRNTMSKLDEIITPVENELRLEESAIKDLAQSEVNKKNKRISKNDSQIPFNIIYLVQIDCKKLKWAGIKSK